MFQLWVGFSQNLHKTIYQRMVCIGTGSCLWWDTGEAMKMKKANERDEQMKNSFGSDFLPWIPCFWGPKEKRNKIRKSQTTTNRLIKSVYPLPASISTCSTAVSIDRQWSAQTGTCGQGDIVTWQSFFNHPEISTACWFVGGKALPVS